MDKGIYGGTGTCYEGKMAFYVATRGISEDKVAFSGCTGAFMRHSGILCGHRSILGWNRGIFRRDRGILWDKGAF